MNLVLLDIDGTLTDTKDVDTSCFVQALADVFGIVNVDTDWSKYPDATDSAVTAHLVESRLGRLALQDDIARVREHFHSLLDAEFADSPLLCRAIGGVPQFLELLCEDPDCAAALATGGWSVTACLKLQKAGYDCAGVPMASADDAARRIDICSIAVGRSLSREKVSEFDSIVYVGDGIWDARAAAELGYRFIGVAQGRDAKLLLAEGADLVVSNFDGVDHEELLAQLSR